jgi:hypothetical protein
MNRSSMVIKSGEIVLPTNGLAPGKLPHSHPGGPGDSLQGLGLVAF